MPSSAAHGQAYARFRLSAAGGLGPVGLADSARSRITKLLLSVPYPQWVPLVRGNVISTTAQETRGVFASDLDGDGDLDVISASTEEIAWYENSGSQSYTAHTITNEADLAYCVFAIDLDGDGDQDVLSASQANNRIAWHENDGSQNFTSHTIYNPAYGAQSVTAADLDGDGDLDVLSASWYDDKIAWHENDGNQGFTTHVISTTGERTLLGIRCRHGR